MQQRRVPSLEVELNEPFLDALSGALERAREQGHIAGTMTPGDLLRFPQALAIREKQEVAAGADDQLMLRVEEAIAAAVEDLDVMRSKEGSSCARTLTRDGSCSETCSGACTSRQRAEWTACARGWRSGCGNSEPT